MISSQYESELTRLGFDQSEIPESVARILGLTLGTGLPDDIVKDGLNEMINYANTSRAIGSEATKRAVNDRAVRGFVIRLVNIFPEEMEGLGVEGVMGMLVKE